MLSKMRWKKIAYMLIFFDKPHITGVKDQRVRDIEYSETYSLSECFGLKFKLFSNGLLVKYLEGNWNYVFYPNHIIILKLKLIIIWMLMSMY